MPIEEAMPLHHEIGYFATLMYILHIICIFYVFICIMCSLLHTVSQHVVFKSSICVFLFRYSYLSCLNLTNYMMIFIIEYFLWIVWSFLKFCRIFRVFYTNWELISLISSWEVLIFSVYFWFICGIFTVYYSFDYVKVL